MSDILAQIVERKRQRLAESKRRLPFVEIKAMTRARSASRQHCFIAALQRDAINIIAEIKRRSPSKGLIRAHFDPVSIARNYTAGGAACLSVLTEEHYFEGSLNYLRVVREVTTLPLLRKDFIFDEYQLYEAVQVGADAILLIAAMMDWAYDEVQFNDLLQTAHGLGLDVLVEIHDRAEAEKVLKYDVRLLGVNNRNLRTFETTLETSVELAAELPRTLTLVSESGIRTRADLDRLRAAGYHAFLIGEELMRADDEGAALRELVQ